MNNYWDQFSFMELSGMYGTDEETGLFHYQDDLDLDLDLMYEEKENEEEEFEENSYESLGMCRSQFM
jgi:hypothetical protein